MQISTIMTPAVDALPVKDAPTAVLKAEQNPAIPAADPSPALHVTLSPINAVAVPPPVYDLPLIDRVYVRDQTNPQQGITSALVTKTLASHLGALRENTGPFSAGLFFSQAGALSRETSSYNNEARHVQVPAKVAIEKFTPDFTRQTGKTIASATVHIRTRDGDTISLNLVQDNDGNGLSFSFTVDGDLSEAEQQALEKLTTKLGEVSDEFFRSGTAELRGLEEFDASVLGSFNLSLRQFNGTDYDTFTYDYSVDSATNTAQLSGKDVAGYTFDISAQLHGLVDGKNPAAHQSLEQYLTLIRQAADDHGTHSSSLRFMLDGLRSMLLPASDTVTGNGPLARLVENFDSGLPDFAANFKSPVVHNPSNYSQVSFMSLSVGQKTHAEQINSRILIQQENYYELSRNSFEAPAGQEKADLENGNYVYVNHHIREGVTRTLDTEGGKVKDIFVERALEWQRHEQVFRDFEAIDNHRSGDSEKELVNLIDQLDANKNQYDLLGLLRSSHKNLFNRW